MDDEAVDPTLDPTELDLDPTETDLAEADDLLGYQSKSPAAGRMGKATEYLVAATCILTTRGELNVSTSLVDDEGVDLVFNRRNLSATLSVQVKARMSDSVRVASGGYVAFVRQQTFTARPDLDMLFVAVDVETGVLMFAWLVPSTDFAAKVGKATPKGRLRFIASSKAGSKDKWSGYYLTPAQLAPKILERLTEIAIGN